ncbi:MAG: 1-acyl-sn-glycerol-3-phosphate acyltransferase [Bacteroidales bacterium]|jgi:1-acyl-sn-glycerol-3-phosphate acyltransferase|nr:1-acyl-sn-glycerol-3-phosphate acyltransferase [Bacteroidales bacterium]
MNNNMFHKVSRFSLPYLFLRECFRFSFKLIYFRRFYVRTRNNNGSFVKGVQGLPQKDTPIVVVSNHQNGLTDALLILFALPRRFVPVYMARADIFKKKWIAAILYFFRLIPIYRMRDGKESLSENEHIFTTAAHIIQKGLPICLFPEGMHQEGHWLGTVKKGFAKIAFEAAMRMDFPQDMLIVPCGNHYDGYYGYRNEVLFTFGDPILLSGYYDMYRENPPKACLQLAHDIELCINELMLNIDVNSLKIAENLSETEKRNLYETLNTAREAERPAIAHALGIKHKRLSLPEKLLADRAYLEKIRKMTSAEFNAYLQSLQNTSSIKQRPKQSRKKTTLIQILLLLLSPISAVGFLLNSPSVLLGERLAKKLSRKNKMLRSGIEYVAGEILFTTLLYIIYTILFFTLMPTTINTGVLYLAFLVLLFVSKVLWLETGKHFTKRSQSNPI